MRREQIALFSPAMEGSGDVVAYGDYGRPVLAFPSEQGSATDYEDRGMVDSIAWLIEEGRTKLYCVGTYDASSWMAAHLSLEERAREHGKYEDWILNQVVPWIVEDCSGRADIVTNGCSFGAYHAVNFALKRADRFPLAIGQSGSYDISNLGPGDGGDTFYFNNPISYMTNQQGDPLRWLRDHAYVVLVCGQGQWEDTTGSLDSTLAFQRVLADKGISHEMDLWGNDVPHDWPSWRSQFAHHLQRFC
ncbi:MAG: alpha/beta hydrolase-fold protein [Actinomycetota bacterium]|nr:alpha/beta hydrolase-fold protein [Actinomycetota bacterium]